MLRAHVERVLLPEGSRFRVQPDVVSKLRGLAAQGEVCDPQPRSGEFSENSLIYKEPFRNKKVRKKMIATWGCLRGSIDIKTNSV
jgi:hypothetical protein